MLILNIFCNKSDTKVKSNGKKLFERKGDLVYLRGSNIPYTGEIKDTLKDRILDYHLVKGTKDGEFKVSYLNGKPQIEGVIKNGLNEGLWKYYYDDGNIESEGEFKNDTAAGKWQWFFYNGKVKEEGNFVGGKRNGIWKDFDTAGKLIKTKKFRSGVEEK
jgi:antitoxin component YwqK of YwqJK toxin-antitoxin module